MEKPATMVPAKPTESVSPANSTIGNGGTNEPQLSLPASEARKARSAALRMMREVNLQRFAGRLDALTVMRIREDATTIYNVLVNAALSDVRHDGNAVQPGPYSGDY